jgi:adenylosuccinate synthase
MKNIKTVIGANFGDEGKGLMTDYFCSLISANKSVLNIRFNGGAQAGHTVVTPDGFRHVFNHVGAGSFNRNVDTYLSSYFVLNPILFKKEWNRLQKYNVVPKIFVNSKCMVTFPCDMMINQIAEKFRDKNNHGSCGVGVYETICRNNLHNYIAIEAIRHAPYMLIDILLGLAKTYVPNRLKELGVDKISVEDMELLNNVNIIKNYISDIEFMLDRIFIVDDHILNHYDNLVFEGAQGLLLDRDNREYFPNLTPSNTGVKNVLEIVKDYKYDDMEVCYVTRSYLTRHGAGKLKTECNKNKIKENVVDLTNHTNEFQGDFRYGYFDENTFKKYVLNDIRNLYDGAAVSIAVTHLDESNDAVVIGDGQYKDIADISSSIGIDVRYQSFGFTRNDIKC